MKITRKLLKEFGAASYKNDAGEHFTKWLNYKPLEELGLIKIDRPIHATGIPYSQEYWELDSTPLGEGLADEIFDDCGNLIENATSIASDIIAGYGN